MKIPSRKALEIEELVLVEYKNKRDKDESVLKVRLACEEKTEEFLYDQGNFGSITLSDITRHIVTSTGRAFSQMTDPNGRIIIQTNYPSIKNLLTSYLPKGGWLTDEQAVTLDVVGYPSQDGTLDLGSIFS